MLMFKHFYWGARHFVLIPCFDGKRISMHETHIAIKRIASNCIKTHWNVSKRIPLS